MILCLSFLLSQSLSQSLSLSLSLSLLVRQHVFARIICERIEIIIEENVIDFSKIINLTSSHEACCCIYILTRLSQTKSATSVLQRIPISNSVRHYNKKYTIMNNMMKRSAGLVDHLIRNRFFFFFFFFFFCFCALFSNIYPNITFTTKYLANLCIFIMK